MMTAIATWTLTYLVHSTILIVGALAIGRALRGRPDLMSGVWKAALVGGILTATVQTGLGAGTPIAVGQGPLLAGVEGIEPAPVLADLAADPLVTPALPVEPVPVAPASAASPSDSSASAPWAPYLAAVTLVGIVFGLLSVALAWWSLAMRLRERTPVTDGPLVAMLVRLRRLAGLRRHVGLFVAARAQVPLATGIVRPRIVVPPRATSLPDAHQQTMLAHELAHVRRHDPAWRLIALLVERGLFFQPLNRLAARRMTECAEFLCDDWAARATRQPLALASCLTEIAGWSQRVPRPMAASAMAGPSSQLRGRVERLLAPPRRRPGAPWASIGIAAAFVGVIAIAPAVTQGKPHDPVVVRVSPDAAVALPEVDDVGPVIVATGPDGRAVVVTPESGADPAAAAAPAPANEDRKTRRRVAKANRKARRQLDKAMRKARKEGRATPSHHEVQAILDAARAEAGQAPTRRHRSTEDARSIVIQSPDGLVRIEIHDGGTRVRRSRHPSAQVDRDMQRQLRQAERQAERMQRQADAMRREAERMHREMMRDLVLAPAPPVPPSPPVVVPAPAPPAPPRPPGRAKNPFAAPAPPSPPGRMKHPFAGRPTPPRTPKAPAKNPFAPRPPTPPDVVLQ